MSYIDGCIERSKDCGMYEGATMKGKTMKVKDMIERLEGFNPEADFFVNVNWKYENFSFAFGEGADKENCETVCLYVDRLNGPSVECPECLRKVPQEELDMFGGQCEECTTT